MLARKIDEAIHEFYRPAEETAHVVEESDNLRYWADGTPATEIIQEIAGVDTDLADALDAYLSHMEQHDIRDGGDAYYDDTPLEHIRAYPEEFMEAWHYFAERLKHEVRFFDEEGKRRLDDLFKELPSLAGGKSIVTIEPGGEFATIYRARIVDVATIELCLKEPARELGPPPPIRARAGRMNPVGISVFYGAFSEQVALAEIRPPVGAVVAVGEFKLLRPVRLLDLPALSFVYHNRSIFSPDYDWLRNYVAFLGRVDRLLARPVLPSDEALEYLPTQAVAAYITNVMGLDGVIYRSTQVGADQDPFKPLERTFCNIALFGAAARVEKTSKPSTGNPEPAPPPTVPRMFLPGIGAVPVLEHQNPPTASHAAPQPPAATDAQPGAAANPVETQPSDADRDPKPPKTS